MVAPLVSIIIPTFNYGHLISDTLNCLLNQSYKNWEAIIIDDGSTDETEFIIEKFTLNDQRINYFYQKNAGLPAARNTGIAFAKGSYLTFLDADDLISKTKIELQVQYMEQYQNCTISYTDAKYFQSGNIENLYRGYNLDQEEWMPTESGGFDELLPIFIMTIMPVNSPLIRRSFIEKTSMSFNIEYKSYEDWDFWLNCLHKGAKYHYINNDDAKALIRVHNHSMRTNSFTMSLYDLNLRKQMRIYINEYNHHDKMKLFKLNHRNLLHACRRLIRLNNKFIFKGLKIVYKEIGLTETIILVFKELNSYRKELSHPKEQN